MTTVTINIPDKLNLKAFDVHMTLVGQWYDQGMLSAGEAAELLDISKRTFIELLGKYNLSVFGYEFDELESDLANV